LTLVSFLTENEKPTYKLNETWDGLYERPFWNHSSDHGSPSKTKGFFLPVLKRPDCDKFAG